MKTSCGIIVLLCALQLGRTLDLDRLVDLIRSRVMETELRSMLKEADIREEDMTPKVRKWFQDLFDRTRKYRKPKVNHSYKNVEGLTDDLDWIQDLLETARDTVVEWTQQDDFYYTTDSWIDLAVSSAETVLTVCPREWWLQLVDIANDPNEDFSYILMKLHKLRMEQQAEDLDKDSLKDGINFIAGLMENDDLE